jgi:hypothetical protein
MQSTAVERRPANRVLAVFEAGAVSFELPRVATFEHLAERLGSLREQCGGALIRIDVRVGA